jgi:peroxiredoxin
MKKRISLIIIVAIFIAFSNTTSRAVQPTQLEIGESAPDFNLPGIDGKNHKLADFSKSDILVVIFTCNHCPTAQAYEKRIIKLTDDYKDKSVAVVSISPNDPKAVRLDELGYTDLGDSLEDMKIRAKQKGFNFPYLFDGDTQSVSRLYGPVSTPHVFIFDKQRKLRYIGRIDDGENPVNIKSHDTRNAIEALLAGKKVAVSKTRTFGCSIKWADKRDSIKKTLERWANEDVGLEMIDAAGIKKTVANKTDKLLLVNVWATWCSPCVAEFDELLTINRMYRKRDFQLVTISADSSDRKNKVLDFLEDKQASFTNYLFDSENKYTLMEAVDEKSLGGIPYTILIKPGGEIIYRQLGLIEPLELKKIIVEQLGRYFFKAANSG